MSSRARVTAALLFVASAACDEAASLDAPPAGSAASPAASARRPSRRYLLTHDGAGCAVSWVEGERSAAPEETPCPPDLEAGERIRLTGRTCLREGPDPARVRPVVCPDPLTNLEKYERGEKKRDD